MKKGLVMSPLALILTTYLKIIKGVSVNKLNSIKSTNWNVIVIGTGVGGATLGHALAKAGKSVLFLEKGRVQLKGNCDSISGRYAEDFFDTEASQPENSHRDILRRAGRYWEKILEVTSDRPYAFSPFIGEGGGGSSALYGMVMERFFPEDFNVNSYFNDVKGANLPDAWPISYEDIRPYYVLAERLYRVRGGLDPLRKPLLDPLINPPALSKPSGELYDFLLAKGLHPYVMPMACEYVPGCQECIGYICPKNCKNDSSRICIKPALEEYSAELLEQCEVSHLEATTDRVTRVWCKYGQETLSLSADLIILAAGALHTPAILLKSKSPTWPNGLANQSGMVGKNLMRHYFDLYCVDTRAKVSAATLIKQIALNDAYFDDGHKLGTVQAVGRLQSSDVLVKELWQEFERKGYPIIARLIRSVTPLITYIVNRNISQRLILTGIMEDIPYEHNFVDVTGSENDIKIHYKISEYDKKRISLFRKKVKELLHPYTFTFVKNAENNERLAHACGTCRFGNDPATSVLSADNRAHGLENLYVVDASFFPTSTGINPSLTLAANALRVADHILLSSESLIHVQNLPTDSMV